MEKRHEADLDRALERLALQGQSRFRGMIYIFGSMPIDSVKAHTENFQLIYLII